MEKAIAITGASGFIGKQITRHFGNKGYRVIPIKREILKEDGQLDSIVREADVVINLAGAPILARWTGKKRQEIMDSRILTTRRVVAAINRAGKPPTHFISASAIGLYDESHEHTEASQYVKTDFMAQVVMKWEEEAKRVNDGKIKVIIFRLGIVLGKNDGVMKKFVPIIKLGLGAILGSGMQHFPFIHIDDVMNALQHVMQCDQCKGIYNVVAPGTATNKEFTRLVAEKMKKPVFFRIPEQLLRLVFMDGATVLFEGQRVIPERLLAEGFIFQYDTLNKCIENIVRAQSA